MQFIDDKRDHPVRRLKQIIEVQPKANPSAYAGLDHIYTQILDTTVDTGTLRNVLGVIVTRYHPITLCELENLLLPKNGDVSLALEGLHLIVNVPAEDGPVTMYHESLRDFLLDSQHSTKYCINLPTCHGIIADNGLTLMTSKFQSSFCALDHPDIFSSELWYACECWAIHLRHSVSSPPSTGLVTSLETFGITSILCWINALSLINELATALHFVRETHQWLSTMVGFLPAHFNDLY
jgi:hypothetical protein